MMVRTTGSRSPLDFVGVGAARCATTWLARCLEEHPAVHLPPRKELHYFDNDFRFEPGLRRVRRALAGAAPGQIRGEFTPRYMIRPRALERIARCCPGVRVVVSLRDPVERAFSQWLYFRFDLRKEPCRSFEEALAGPFHEDYVVKSRYAGPLVMLRSLFGPQRIHVILYDDIRDRPGETLRGLYEFLGVDPDVAPPSGALRVNSSTRRAEAPAVWAALAQRLALGRALPMRLLRQAARPVVPIVNGLIDLALPRPAASEVPRLEALQRLAVFERYFKTDLQATEKILGRGLPAWYPAGGAAPSSAHAA
jgi:hypothetical protein